MATRWYASTRLYGATSQKTVLFTEFYLLLPLLSTTDTYLPFQNNFLSRFTSKEKDEKLPRLSELPIFSLFPYFEELKVGLRHAVSVPVNSLPPPPPTTFECLNQSL
jgi:hypothetical protein